MKPRTPSSKMRSWDMRMRKCQKRPTIWQKRPIIRTKVTGHGYFLYKRAMQSTIENVCLAVDKLRAFEAGLGNLPPTLDGNDVVQMVLCAHIWDRLGHIWDRLGHIWDRLGRYMDILDRG